MRFKEAVFVLHCFQKKSKRGIATHKGDLDIIRATLKVAAALAKELRIEKKRLIDGIEVQRSSGNVYAALGLPDAERLEIKTGLVVEIRNAMRHLGPTQQEAAKRMVSTRPKVPDMMRGDFSNFSERKLTDCLNRLGYDIEIKVQQASAPFRVNNSDPAAERRQGECIADGRVRPESTLLGPAPGESDVRCAARAAARSGSSYWRHLPRAALQQSRRKRPLTCNRRPVPDGRPHISIWPGSGR